MKKSVYLAIDIGGSFIKGVCFEFNNPDEHITEAVSAAEIVRVPSYLGEHSTVEKLNEAFGHLFEKMNIGNFEVKAMGISTAGLVNYAGNKIILSAKHLYPLQCNKWIDFLQNKFRVPVTIINDADAFAIGVAQAGMLKGNKTIGIMPVGTGLGFSLWRNGRKWTPWGSLVLLGSILTPVGSYDEIASASGFAANEKDGNLADIFNNSQKKEIVAKYLSRLSEIISTAHTLFHVDKIILGGGLFDGAEAANFPILEKLKESVNSKAHIWADNIELEQMPFGNKTALIGAGALAVGEGNVASYGDKFIYSSINTETPYDSKLNLQKLSSQKLLSLLWGTEQDAGIELKKSLDEIEAVIETTLKSLNNGGRIIYVGCGTSGRLAAVDTVEIACTFGFPRERVLTLISGGVADCGIDIETNFEEDASSVPDMLMASVSSKDIVIGISVSGSAYYVKSALCYAKSMGAKTVMIQESPNNIAFCDHVIALRSGHEIIAGSTRMKAGTATKKVLNFISTVSMVRLGKVHGSYMVDLECLNEKLINRAVGILKTLYGISNEQGMKLLSENDFNLLKSIEALEAV